MSDLSSSDRDRYQLVRGIVEELYRDVTRKARSAAANLPGDIWSDYVRQVREGEALNFEMYEDAVKNCCSQAVAKLDQEVQAMLWLWSDGYLDYDDDTGGIPYGEIVEEGVTEEIYRRLYNLVEEEDCPQADAAALGLFEEDMEPDRQYEASLVTEQSRSDCLCVAEDANIAAQALMELPAEVLLQDSHFSLKLRRCERCGREFLSVFTELTDFEGDDSVAITFVLINQEEADRLRQSGEDVEEYLAHQMNRSYRYLVDNRPGGEPRSCSWGYGPRPVFPHD